MKKILISSLCALFSFDGASGMEIVELLNPESKSVSGPCGHAIPGIEESHILWDKGDEENVKLIQDAVCWRYAKLKATLENDWRWLEFIGRCLLFNTETRQIQEFSPAQEKVFTQLCKSKGTATVAAIANKIQKSTFTVYYHITELGDLLDGIGVEILHIMEKIQINVKVVTPESPDSTTTVSIPLTKKREIIGPSGTVRLLTYESVNKVPTKASQDSPKISYFIDINGKLQRVGYRDARLLDYLGELELNTQFTAGDIIAQATVNGKEAFSEDSVRTYISRVRSWLEECGLEIIKEEEGYKMQAIGGANMQQGAFGNAQFAPQGQLQGMMQLLSQLGTMMQQLSYQHQQLWNLVQNNMQIMYGQQIFENDQFASQLDDQPQQLQNRWQNDVQNENIPLGNSEDDQLMSQPYDQMQQYQEPSQNSVKNADMALENFGNAQLASQGQPIGGAQYVNQGAIGVGNFF